MEGRWGYKSWYGGLLKSQSFGEVVRCCKSIVEWYIREAEKETTASNRYVKIDVALLLAGPKLLLTAREQDRHHLPRKSSGCKSCTECNKHNSCNAKGLPKPWLPYLATSRISCFPIMQALYEA